MRILALETDIAKKKQRWISQDEQEIATIFRHGFFFVLSVIYQSMITTILIMIGILLFLTESISGWTVTTGIFIIWLLFSFSNLLKTYLDWRYDFLLITDDKIVWVEQSSIFHQKVKQMNLENIASVSAETQFWNVFPFGALQFDLKEGIGHPIKIKYISHADKVADMISDVCTKFQRKRMYSHM
ncbi:hypothetical protein A3D11_00550 [Candidatus Peribacteria bacterium RIFCSPHIGHO2_02_FULL_49_16]|nr:MAG: hypothetical protein A2880_03510 [Candidatus Peribacteria bacterium RIFCSPHIGHO2_01_FULL_49_38]OGJ59476.1 MAG: hypothetical protein A3D11_00550 [Candidatus Peribacteria bacterium RIFCSPHIGHO2_02_FULL_49_16]